MRRKLLVLFSLVCGIRPYARPVQHADHSREQTNFGVEDTFRNPLAIPLDALQKLRMSIGSNDAVQECAKDQGIPAAEIPASWFVASEIQLTGKPSSGLVVRGENICLLGAHIAHFWVLAKSPQGYRVVFQGRADGLSVLPTRTNGYRDLELVIVTKAGANVDLVRLRYSEGQYHVSGHRVEHN